MKKFKNWKTFLFIGMIIALAGMFTAPLLAQDNGGGVLGNLDISQILTWAFGILSGVFGGAWAWIKDKSAKLAKASKEALDVAMAANTLLQNHNTRMADGTLTKDEIQGYVADANNIATQVTEALAALKALGVKD